MLYVYFGEDVQSARTKVQATVSNMLSKNPDALYFRITTDELPTTDFNELTGAQALFKSEYVVVLDTLLSSKEGEEAVLGNIREIAESSHPFFVLDAKITAPIRKKLEKYASKVHEFELKKKTETKSFNTFALTDALAEKNIKKLWTLFREAKHNNISDEEIHGILFWMLKSISLAAQSKTAEEAGMKAYPYSKAKSALKQFGSMEKVNALLTSFSTLPQISRRAGTPLEIELEKFILSLR